MIMFLTAFRRTSAPGKSQRNLARHRRLAVEPLEQRTLLSTTTLFLQQARLHGFLGAAGDAFGDSVATSGKTMVVGSPFATVSGNTSQGAVYVFTDISGGWLNLRAHRVRWQGL